MKKKVFFALAIMAVVLVFMSIIAPVVEALSCVEQFEACICGCGVHPTDKCFRGCMAQYDGCL